MKEKSKRYIQFLDQVIQLIIHSRQEYMRLNIAISGAAAVGKTSFAKAIVKRLNKLHPERNVTYLQLDAFMLTRDDRKRLKISGYDPRSHRIDLLYNCLSTLENGSEFSYRPYNHRTGKALIKAEVVKPSEILVLDGIHSFHKKISRFVDLGVFMTGSPSTLKALRFITDTSYRGYTDLEALKHSENEFKNYMKYIYPYQKRADVLIEINSEWNYAIISKPISNGSFDRKSARVFKKVQYP